METSRRKRPRIRSDRRATPQWSCTTMVLHLLATTTPAAAQYQEANTDLSNKLPSLIADIKLSDTYWQVAKAKNRGSWEDGWTISSYPADFFLYKIFTDTTFEALKTTCKSNNSTIWDLEAAQLNQMTKTWNNQPYFMSKIKQRKAVPEKFTTNTRDCTTVRKDQFSSIIIEDTWNNDLCETGYANGICVKVMDSGYLGYTKLPTYTADKKWVYDFMETRIDAQKLTNLAKTINAYKPETTAGMTQAIHNIRQSTDTINKHIGLKGILPTDFTSLKLALTNTERQIRYLFTQVTTATLLEPASQKLLLALKSGNTSVIINQLQEQFQELLDPDNFIPIAGLVWFLALTGLVLLLINEARKTKKKLRTYSDCFKRYNTEPSGTYLRAQCALASQTSSIRMEELSRTLSEIQKTQQRAATRDRTTTASHNTSSSTYRPLLSNLATASTGSNFNPISRP